MVAALVLSGIVHVIPVVAVHVLGKLPAKPRPKAAEPLEVVLVNQKTTTRPSRADVLAQANVDGGGNTDAKHTAKSPLPAKNAPPSTELEQKHQEQQQLEQKAAELMRQIKSQHAAPAQDSKLQQPKPEGKGVDQESLREQARDLAAMAAQIDRDYNAYQQKPRKAFVGVRAQQTSVAMYVDTWRQKIERVGTLTYPTDSHGQKLFGSLRVTVEIAADGSIASTSIEKSSGNPELDAQALRILKLASPFPPLPGDIKATDSSGQPAQFLVITRTWTFAKGGSFGTQY
ncbi:cell envelope integrity protein TolA [Chitinilyticum piscinae]|uniref:TonB family protein n=1 Tax=Chitinilyticum piscinae TaxID=2866724 RepID=A0A8J7FEV3_9NEIS|nr:energy transducer TonB [Chitinilyticum piscinae]MBE9608118.1 TonB family protein [Chitinilyticum piscinae]